MKKVYFAFIALVFICLAAQAEDAPDAGVMMLKLDANVLDQAETLGRIFEIQGSNSVADSLHTILQNPNQLQKWQEFARGTEVRVVDVRVHEKEEKAVAYMNKRFKRMGLGNLKFNVILDNSQTNPTDINEGKIKHYKWLRYAAGPGVAAFAALYTMNNMAADSGGNYFVLLLPTAGVGLTSVVLEYQFAHPWMSKNIWQPLWRFGGPILGRITNIAVNFLYGMALYTGGTAFSYIPTFWGESPVSYVNEPLGAVALASFLGGLKFHFAMGQYQTDISSDVIRGNSDATEVYKKESVGVIWNNSGRITATALGADVIQNYVLGAFFLAKTLPQVSTTHIKPFFKDRKIRKCLESLK